MRTFVKINMENDRAKEKIAQMSAPKVKKHEPIIIKKGLNSEEKINSNLQ